MKDKTKYTLPVQIKMLLDAGRYKDSFTLIRRRLTEVPIAGMLNRVSQLESTYKYMLDFLSRGLADPGREDVLADIRNNLLDMAGQIEKEALSTDSPEIYFSTLRICRLRHADLRESISKLIELKAMSELSLSSGAYPDSLMSQIEDLEEKVFNIIWTDDNLSKDDYSAIVEAVKSGSIPFTTSALCIAAAGLALMKYYSRDAFLLLISLSKEADPRIASRAMSSLVLALSRWNKEVAFDKRLMEALDSLNDKDGIPEKVRTIVKTIIRTRDTDRISKKMQREVIPGLMQFGPDIIKRLKKSSEDSSFADLEANPEWEELLSKSGLEDKLRELTEMQSEGADVMMVAFSNLKNFPFFRRVRNWFLPFTIQHPMLRSFHSNDEVGVSSMLEMSGLMCDSDKYSFSFSLASMPEAQRNMVLSQMHAQTEQIKQQMDELKILKAGTEFETYTTGYLRDLYRFHKLFPKRGEFFDPFASALDFTAIPVVSDIMESGNEARPIAEFYFKKGYYADALPLFNSAAARGATQQIWEKIGFCLEKTHSDNKDTIEAYMKAQLFNPDSRWISRRLGICYRRAGDFRNALEYLREARPENGDFDRNLSLLIADTYADAGKWQEALQELYRVDYENPDDPEVIRKIARCAFRAGDLKKADTQLKLIPNISLSEEDYRLMGHIAFLNKDMTEATRLYRHTVRPNDETRLWKTQILSDIDILTSLGASRFDLTLLLESIAYSLE